MEKLIKREELLIISSFLSLDYMILNVSGRTDIVAFYSKWFMNRYREGYVDVRNPFYPKNVSRICFDDVDLILFFTKNARPIIPYLSEIKKNIIFHVTLTPYKKDVEPNVKDKKLVIKDIKELSKILGKDFVYVRYDPIFISDKYNIFYHVKAFDKLCKLLNGYVNTIIVSFIDNYKNVRKNEKTLNFKEFTEEDYRIIGENFSKSAKENNIKVQTCFEEEDLIQYGFNKGECLSHELAYVLTGKKFKNWTARKGGKCKCVEMVDIGAYNTCNHMCKYCYANFNEEEVLSNIRNHDENSSLLIGVLNNDDEVKVRK